MQDLKPQLLKLLGPAAAPEPVSFSHTVEASLQSCPAKQRLSPLMHQVTGFGLQTLAHNHPRCTLQSLSSCAKVVVQQQTWQLKFCALGSYAPGQRKRYALHKTSQCLNRRTVPVRFQNPASSCCMHGFPSL